MGERISGPDHRRTTEGGGRDTSARSPVETLQHATNAHADAWLVASGGTIPRPLPTRRSPWRPALPLTRHGHPHPKPSIAHRKHAEAHHQYTGPKPHSHPHRAKACREPDTG